MLRSLLSIAVLGVLSTASAFAADLPTKKTLNLEAAKQIVAGAEAEAARQHITTAVIAVLDDGGNLLFFERLDEARIASVTVAQQKAYSAVIFRQPTKAFEEALKNGRLAVLRLPGAFPSEGGVPLLIDGKVIGAVGVSGGTSEQDGQVAAAGIAVLTK
jgi:uncharacterized protein GlcG (DUF336 family)